PENVDQLCAFVRSLHILDQGPMAGTIVCRSKYPDSVAPFAPQGVMCANLSVSTRGAFPGGQSARIRTDISDAGQDLAFFVATLLASLVIALTVYVCFAYSDRVQRVLGDVGTDILVRLTAFILFCLGMQIIWTGASELIGTLMLQKAAMAMPR